jgi:PTS system nitrogen regulatory IIA component
MHLSVKSVARALNVSETTLYRWIDRGTIPVHQINGHCRFNTAELMEWAAARDIHLAPGDFSSGGNGESERTSLAQALDLGGVHYGVAGRDKSSVLRSVVKLLPLSAGASRDALLELLLARESAGSTAIGDGIALPHARNPIVMAVERPAATLCFLAQPINFDSLDGQPVSILFTVVSPAVRSHLRLLSLLGFALRDSNFKSAVLRRASKAEILEEAARIEGRLLPTSSSTGEDD